MRFWNFIPDRRRVSAWLPLLLFAALLLPGCALIHSPYNSGLPVSPNEQPDKILLDKALKEFKHGQYDTGRLLLQSLLNTYPDSEYLSQAKLAIASSYYKQGGIAGLTEADAEYKDFITFFPTAPEAPMAQYRAAMCHFRLMGKADRDPTEAVDAERELEEFLTKYPNNPLMPDVKARLREVQQVLANGEFDIAMFYFRRQANEAAEGRLKDIVQKYPNYSQGAEVFWYLGQALKRLHKPREAIPYYDRLVMEFPLSPLVKEAKMELVAMHAPVPKPTLAMLARAKADAVRHDHRTMVQKLFGGLSGAPNYSQTLHGPVILGSPNQIKVQIAELNKSLPPPAKNTLTVETASTANSAAAGKVLDPDAKHLARGSSKNKKTPEAKAGEGSSAKPAVSPAKKKAKRSLLRRLLPF